MECSEMDSDGSLPCLEPHLAVGKAEMGAGIWERRFYKLDNG